MWQTSTIVSQYPFSPFSILKKKSWLCSGDSVSGYKSYVPALLAVWSRVAQLTGLFLYSYLSLETRWDAGEKQPPWDHEINMRNRDYIVKMLEQNLEISVAGGIIKSLEWTSSKFLVMWEKTNIPICLNHCLDGFCNLQLNRMLSVINRDWIISPTLCLGRKQISKRQL